MKASLPINIRFAFRNQVKDVMLHDALDYSCEQGIPGGRI